MSSLTSLPVVNGMPSSDLDITPSLLAVARCYLMSKGLLTADDLQQICSRTSSGQSLSEQTLFAYLETVTAQITEDTCKSLLRGAIPNELIVKIFTHVIDHHHGLKYDLDYEDDLFEAMLGTSPAAKALRPAMREACFFNMRCKITVSPGRGSDLRTPALSLHKIRHCSLVFPVTRRGQHWTDLIPFTRTLSHIKSSMPQLRTLVCYFRLRRTAFAARVSSDHVRPWVDGVVSLIKDMRSIMPTVTFGMKFQGYCWDEGPVVCQVVRKRYYSDGNYFENGWALAMLAMTQYGDVEAAEGETDEEIAALLSSKNVIHERQLRETFIPTLYP